MKRKFKNISTVNFWFCAAGQVVDLEVMDGMPVNKSARSLWKSKYLIEVQTAAVPQKKAIVTAPQISTDTETKGNDYVIS